MGSRRLFASVTFKHQQGFAPQLVKFLYLQFKGNGVFLLNRS